ncbi:hypothetical protein KI387_033222, partial [Taxus chinensis]
MASSSAASQDRTQLQYAFDQLAPYSASASAVNKAPYDVFVNHRGCDVKHQLASTIFHTLDLMGLRVFLDKEALEPGDVIPAELQHAITSSSLHIAIFSPNYAQSPWCLAELSFMLKTGIKIIPIFYHVKPSDLRSIDQGIGIYADAFSEHENKGKYILEKLEEWRIALNNISFHSGYMVCDSEDEGRVLKNIVKFVLGTVKLVPLEVAKHPVGLVELVQDFEGTTLQSDHTHQNAKIVGIVGMGGSGKTTLSKELFNRYSSSFERRSFIFDLRAEKNALHNKQKKLMQDLGVSNGLSFDCVEEGKNILANRLTSVRVLIVLDDVDHIDQLDALLPANINDLSSDSLVIVTSRELGVLTSWGISCNFRMPEMNWSHAEQLFCWHAFLQPFPAQSFESTVEKFLKACNGLPLSLKVLGAHLYGKKSRDYWESLLDKISRILPADIRQTLQVSYDALDKEEKEMFLDVACFFIGDKKSAAIAVWDGSGWSGLHGWETLFNKCLVESYKDEDQEEHIWMHDHLRDMGREIACMQSPYRLQDAAQILEIQKKSQEKILIRGIANSIDNFVPFKNHMLQPSILAWIKNSVTGCSRRRSKRHPSSLGLKILRVGSTKFRKEFAPLSEDLLWLCWYGFDRQRILPSWMSFRNLHVLELQDAYNLEELWADNVEPPLQLRNLTITDCHKLQSFPSSIGRLKHLKMISAHFAPAFHSLPDEFCGLQSLEHLQLRSYRCLSSLPAGFGDITNLRHVDLSRSLLKTLPVSFKQLINLEYLNLSYCKKLKLRLDTLENIKKLEYLNLDICWELEVLPREIINQTYLRNLSVMDTKLSYFPTNISRLTMLETLRIGSPLLTSLPTSIGNLSSLTTLGIEDCHQLECLPHTMELLNLLKEVHIKRCGIRELALGGDGSPHPDGNLMEIGTLPASICILKLMQCQILKEIKCIGGVINLQELEIWGCPTLDGLPSFASFASMETFSIRHCPKVQKIEGLEQCRSLKHFIADCPKVAKIEGLEKCRSLEELRVKTCWKVPGIQSLENLERLETLELSCESISALKPCIQSLKECPRLMSIGGRVVRFVMPILKSLALPKLSVMRFEKFEDWENIIPNSLEPAFLWYEEGNESENEESEGVLQFQSEFHGKRVSIIVSRK